MMNCGRFLRGNFEELGLSCSLAPASPRPAFAVGCEKGAVGAGAR